MHQRTLKVHLKSTLNSIKLTRKLIRTYTYKIKIFLKIFFKKEVLQHFRSGPLDLMQNLCKHTGSTYLQRNKIKVKEFLENIFKSYKIKGNEI